jgi:hypothetical protein
MTNELAPTRSKVAIVMDRENRAPVSDSATPIDSVSDLVLLLLYANSRLRQRGPLSGSTRLQKLLFLLTVSPAYERLMTAHLAPEVTFEPYKMGPFTPEVFRAVDLLSSFNPPLIDATPAVSGSSDDTELYRYVDDVDLDRTTGTSPRPATYALTHSGETIASLLWSGASEDLRDQVTGVVKEYGGLAIRELLRYVYAKYPGMTERSEIKGELGL